MIYGAEDVGDAYGGHFLDSGLDCGQRHSVDFTIVLGTKDYRIGSERGVLSTESSPPTDLFYDLTMALNSWIVDCSIGLNQNKAKFHD